MALSLTRIVVTAALCAAAAGAVVFRLSDLYDRPDEQVRAADTTEDKELFFALLKAGVLIPRADGGLDMAPADHFLREEAAGGDSGDRRVRAEKRRLHGILYHAPVGGIIRQQVRLWNESRHLAAVRDNRAELPGDGQALWDAESETGHPLRAGDLVPETFGFIHAGRLVPGFGEWAAVSRDDGAVTFRTRLTVRQPYTLALQVIGKPVKLPEDARVEPRTDDTQWSCATPATAAQVLVPLRTLGEVTLEIKLAPSDHCAPRVHGLAIGLEQDAAGRYTKYDWRPVGRPRPSSQFVLTTADGVLLTDAGGRGRPTGEAYRLGLTPMVGFGPSDTFAVSGLMAATRLPVRGVSAALTIDSKFQAAAQEAVDWGIARFGTADQYAAERKASVVLIDADSGAILAAAGYPTVPAGAQPWDYASFATSFPLRDPASVFGWEVIDQHNTPGSTFKPLVALALMRAAGERPELATIMQGLTAERLPRLAGISAGQTSYAPAGQSRSIDNFGGGTTGRFNTPLRDAAGCKVESRTDPNFGLRQAVQYSINVWFARMAVMLDAPTVDAYLAERGTRDATRAPETKMIETLRWLGIDNETRLDLAANLPPSVSLRRYNSADSADVLYAQVAKDALSGLALPEANPASVKALLLWIVALNGIGQSVSVSPLHMAMATAAIASGSRVRPYLFARWDGEPLAPPKAARLDLDPALLGLLRDGMKAVPEVGTAAGAFAQSPEFRCRTYGKTGTAEIDAGKAFNSGWFIGWVEPGAPGERRLAFACMMTHAVGALRTGGGACAPVVNRMLRAVTGADLANKSTQ